jgi:hypothetical protein
MGRDAQCQIGRDTNLRQPLQSDPVPLSFALNASDYARHADVAVAFRHYLYRRNADHQNSRIRLLESGSKIA